MPRHPRPVHTTWPSARSVRERSPVVVADLDELGRGPRVNALAPGALAPQGPHTGGSPRLDDRGLWPHRGAEHGALVRGHRRPRHREHRGYALPCCLRQTLEEPVDVPRPADEDRGAEEHDRVGADAGVQARERGAEITCAERQLPVRQVRPAREHAEDRVARADAGRDEQPTAELRQSSEVGLRAADGDVVLDQPVDRLEDRVDDLVRDLAPPTPEAIQSDPATQRRRALALERLDRAADQQRGGTTELLAAASATARRDRSGLAAALSPTALARSAHPGRTGAPRGRSTAGSAAAALPRRAPASRGRRARRGILERLLSIEVPVGGSVKDVGTDRLCGSGDRERPPP